MISFGFSSHSHHSSTYTPREKNGRSAFSRTLRANVSFRGRFPEIAFPRHADLRCEVRRERPPSRRHLTFAASRVDTRVASRRTHVCIARETRARLTSTRCFFPHCYFPLTPSAALQWRRWSRGAWRKATPPARALRECRHVSFTANVDPFARVIPRKLYSTRRTTRVTSVSSRHRHASHTLGQLSPSGGRGCAQLRETCARIRLPALSLYPHAPTSHRHIERRAFVNSVLTVCASCVPHHSPPRAQADESRAPARPAVRCQAALLAVPQPRRMLEARLELLLPGRFSLACPFECRRVRRAAFSTIKLERRYQSFPF